MPLTRDDRPTRYVEPTPPHLVKEDGRPEWTVVYRASSLGVCDVHILSVAEGMVGAPMPAWFRDILDEGSLCEGEISLQWEAESGIPTVNDQAECELDLGDMCGKRVIVRGHIDGERMDDQLVGREFKKFRESTWENFVRSGIEVNKNYPWQASVYWHARGWTHIEYVGGHVIGFRCEPGVYCLTCAGGVWHDKPRDENFDDLSPDREPVIGEVLNKPVFDAPIPLKDIRKRVLRWERMIDSGMDASDVECQKPYAYPCPFYTLHADEGEFTFEVNHVAGAVVKRIHGGSRRLSELRAEVKRMEDELKADGLELREIIAEEGPDAHDASVIHYGSLSLKRSRSHVEGGTFTRKAYDKDSFAAVKDADLSAKPAAKKAAKPRKAATSKRTRVGGAQ